MRHTTRVSRRLGGRRNAHQRSCSRECPSAVHNNDEHKPISAAQHSATSRPGTPERARRQVTIRGKGRSQAYAVQSVDVLRNEVLQVAAVLQPDQRPMRESRHSLPQSLREPMLGMRKGQ
jgi:hypothetical protein